MPELTGNAFIRKSLLSRWPQMVLYAIMLAGFLLAILGGLVGTPVGSRNFGIVFTWIAWWAALILVAVPFLGRGWCAVCPIPLPGEWLQRGRLLGPGSSAKSRGLGLRWPNRLRGIWLQNATFMLVALFSPVILTTPSISALVLSLMIVASVILSVIFERRAFCRYICPVSGFIGLYAQAASLELRVRDRAVCVGCKEKPCYNGSEAGYGCPWDVFPGGLTRNSSCGLCQECLRTCPYDNIVLRTRPFGSDLVKTGGRRLDEAFKAFIMLGAALVYAAVLLGPWGGLKLTAYSVGTLAWAGYVATFLVFILILLPVLFLAAAGLGKKLSGNPASLRQIFTAGAYGLVPLGLMGWVAFSLSFVLTNASYILSSLSDPFGWGWDLFGTANLAWSPWLGGVLPFLQTGALMLGLAWSARTALKIASGTLTKRAALLQTSPLILYALLITLVFMALLL